MFEPYDRYIDVEFDQTRTTMVRGLYQFDHGMQLRVHNVPLSGVWQMQFGYRGNRECVTSVGVQDGDVIVADIPDVLLMQQREVICYMYYEDSDHGITVYEIYMPLMPRIRPAAGSYTPAQINTYEQLVQQTNLLISRLDAAIERADDPTFTVDIDDGCLYVTQ